MNIVVCGGGTAGWLSAYILAESQPGIHNVTIIESSSIGIIGAGEGSTGSLNDLVSGKFFKAPSTLEDFMEKTDATLKYGINHVNWGKKKGSYFAPIDATISKNVSPNEAFNYVISRYGAEKAHMSSEIGQLYEHNLCATGNFGFHFNAFKVGKYFKDCLESNKKVKHIDATIKEVIVDPSGNIKSVILDGGKEIEGDFFIDCTGFSRILMKKLDIPWISYKKNLPVDRAMPFIVDYSLVKESVSKPYTTAHALSSGWMWQIPLQDRVGSGYVYSSEFLDEDGAQREVEKVLGHSIEPIRHLSFESGRSDVFWKNNCLSTGLAAAFLEPLEATSIHSTIFQMLVFSFEYT